MDLLVPGIRMPRMDGVALARSVNEKFPTTPILYISGFPLDLDGERPPAPGLVYAFLAKPFSRQALVETVRKCLARC